MADDGTLKGLHAFPSTLNQLAGKLSTRYDFKGQIGEGKTGIAYRLTSVANPAVSFCLKTIKPAITSSAERKETAATLQKECAILAPLHHRCIPAVFEFDFSTDTPYYVCTYHPGTTFFKIRIDTHKFALHETSFIVSSLIDALRYVHDAGRTHCDLHSKNLLISREVIKDGLLIIDFGSGHRESDSSDWTANRGNVNFKDPSGQRQDRLVVSRKGANPHFRASDFIALGALLAQMEDCFISRAPLPTRLAYREFHQRLQHGRYSEWRDVESGFATVVDPYRIITGNDDLFLDKNGARLAITTPVSGGVPVGDAPLEVINTAGFQRLRGIRQLSFCDWLFPGATHTRFEHSLGVFGKAKSAIDALAHDPQFREGLLPEQVRGGLLASLIHDIGHYPFAHMMEQYAAGRFAGGVKAKNAASHEVHGREILERDGQLKDAIASKWGEPALVQAKKAFDGNTPVIAELLNGPIDVDKMDYLSRDAVHCGVRFGFGLDSQQLMRSLCVVANGRGLGVSEDGVSAVEGLMVLQDQMLASVCWNETIRGVIAMFHGMVAKLVGLDVDKFCELCQQLRQCDSDHAAIRDVITPAVGRFVGNDKSKLERMSSLFVQPKYREIYQPSARFRQSDPPPREFMSNVFKAIVSDISTGQSSIPILWHKAAKLREAFIEALSEKAIDADDIDVLVDVPYGKGRRNMLLVKEYRSEVEIPITEVSHLNSSIFEEPAKYLASVRVYLSPEVFSRALDFESSIRQSAVDRFFAASN